MQVAHIHGRSYQTLALHLILLDTLYFVGTFKTIYKKLFEGMIRKTNS